MKHLVPGSWKILLLLVCTFFLAFYIKMEAQQICSNQTGTQEGYSYELWKDDGGTACMTLKSGAAFSTNWNGINNMLARRGYRYNETQKHQQLGTFSASYSCNYQPNGNSYLGVYGWTVDPLVEFYVVDSWGNWRPPGANSKGTITVDGATYDIYETTRVDQPSIKGRRTFQQYWSVRTSKRTSGTISISQHFNAWESNGMPMGNMYDVNILIEGYQSSGTADFSSASVTVAAPNPGSNLAVSPASSSYTSSAGSATVNVTSNVGWTVSDNQSWLSTSLAGGSNNGSFQISVIANTEASSRTGTVTVTGGGITRTITITQAGTSGGSGSNTIVVRARGTNGSETIQLQVNNTTISTWTLTTSMANYSATTSATGGVNVRFNNDANGRDVQVDYIQVNGTTRQAESQTVNTGAYLNGSCGGGSNSEWLHCNGYIGFGNVTSARVAFNDVQIEDASQNNLPRSGFTNLAENGVLTIEVDDETSQVDVIDFNGHSVRSVQVTKGQKKSLDIPMNVSPGIYILQTVRGGKRFSQKVLVR